MTKLFSRVYNISMPEKRENQRYKTLAHARIPHILEGNNPLKDLSVTGCCIESTAYAKIKPETTYQLEIMPEQIARIDSFVLEVESRWVRPEGNSGEVGFSVIASPKGKEFQRYVDYLAYRSSRR